MKTFTLVKIISALASIGAIAFLQPQFTEFLSHQFYYLYYNSSYDSISTLFSSLLWLLAALVVVKQIGLLGMNKYNYKTFASDEAENPAEGAKLRKKAFRMLMLKIIVTYALLMLVYFGVTVRSIDYNYAYIHKDSAVVKEKAILPIVCSYSTTFKWHNAPISGADELMQKWKECREDLESPDCEKYIQVVDSKYTLYHFLSLILIISIISFAYYTTFDVVLFIILLLEFKLNGNIKAVWT